MIFCPVGFRYYAHTLPPVGMGPNHGRFAVGLSSLLCAIGCLLSVVGVIALPLM